MCNRANSKSRQPVAIHFEAFGGASVLASRRYQVLVHQSRLVSSLAPPRCITDRRLRHRLNIHWRHVAWRPRIISGAPVSEPARWYPEVFQRKFSRAVCAGPEAGVPPTGLFGAILPAHQRIQFPIL